MAASSRFGLSSKKIVDVVVSLLFFSYCVLKAVLDARNNLEIGSLNPMPFGITVVNCIGK